MKGLEEFILKSEEELNRWEETDNQLVLTKNDGCPQNTFFKKDLLNLLNYCKGKSKKLVISAYSVTTPKSKWLTYDFSEKNNEEAITQSILHFTDISDESNNGKILDKFVDLMVLYNAIKKLGEQIYIDACGIENITLCDIFFDRENHIVYLQFHS